MPGCSLSGADAALPNCTTTLGIFMDQPVHPLSELFAQLGLPADEASIRQFITAHAPLRADIDVADAPFWTESQADFLKEQKLEDADWAEVVDQLNLALRG